MDFGSRFTTSECGERAHETCFYDERERAFVGHVVKGNGEFDWTARVRGGGRFPEITLLEDAANLVRDLLSSDAGLGEGAAA